MTSLYADDAFLGHVQLNHDPFAPRVPGFKFQVSGFRFRVPGSGFQVSGFRFQVPGSKFQVPGFEADGESGLKLKTL